MPDLPPLPSNRLAITDSPWFWMMLFCGGGLVLLLAFSPKYAKRQKQLEMQYQARQETLRRHVEREGPIRTPGDEESTAPRAFDDLIIPLAPLLEFFAVLLALSAAMLWRARRSTASASHNDSVAASDPKANHQGGQA